jgi:conjugal transfer pilus assembly protein TraE
MITDNLSTQYNLLLKQRKNLTYLVVSQAAAIVILAAIVAYVVLNPTVVIAPPIVDSMFKVKGDKLSDSGLQQHANYFMHLYLDLTPETIDSQHVQLAQFIHPNAQVEFKKQLAEHEAVVKKLHLSSRFDIKSIATNVASQTVTLAGRLVFYQGPSPQGEKDKTFVMQFSNKLGKPFILRITEGDNANK